MPNAKLKIAYIGILVLSVLLIMWSVGQFVDVLLGTRKDWLWLAVFLIGLLGSFASLGFRQQAKQIEFLQAQIRGLKNTMAAKDGA